MIPRLLVVLLLHATLFAYAQGTPELTKEDYVKAVTRGAGLMPGQTAGPSPEEEAFRSEIEARKDCLLEYSPNVAHPILYTEDDLARARRNAETSDWAKQWRDTHIALADYVTAQPPEWIVSMLPEETPGHCYGFTCPNCVGVKSQEAVGNSIAGWSRENPEVLTCRACGQVYPDAAYRETAELLMPRSGHRITYYLNERERAEPEDRSGKLAWHWVGHPMHVSFTGLIREKKIGFMRKAAESLAFAYAFTGETRYAVAAREVLTRYAHCYRNWLYHDYWDGYADCDPLYAAWHDKALPLVWKRHLCEQAFAKDSVEKAAMLQTYWGAGRVHPSTDGVSGVATLALAYDLTCMAKTAGGSPVWGEAERRLVERDLLVEYILGAEPYAGGPGKATNANNKAPRIYNAMAAVAKCLGIPALADTALRGYECVRDGSFNADGFSTESPSYNNMYLSQLLRVPETLHGFTWPEGFEARQGRVDYYASDAKLRLMYRAILQTLLPSGHYLPLSDTHVDSRPSASLIHMGLKRYPGFFAGTAPRLGAARMSEYAMFRLTQEALESATGLRLSETCFPDWQTAILRHFTCPAGITLTLAFNPWGGHRHQDNLALFYDIGGRTILGDQGYVGDMPMNAWIRSTLSHNLVVVDQQEQRRSGRQPEFQLMATSPLASVVEAFTDAYAQCTEYRRRTVLVKGPGAASFAIDLFRVTGGKHHAFRVYSECASSDSPDGTLSFEGVPMPPETPLPQVGASMAREDIFGLRDVRSAAPSGPWQATWRDEELAYRLWMLSDCGRVEASNGPGQRDRKETGRRVRYVDAVREGNNLSSTYLAVHTLGRPEGTLAITAAERLDVAEGGPRAAGLRVVSSYGIDYCLHDFDEVLEVDGIRFQGQFALLRLIDGEVAAYLTVGATLLDAHGVGFEDAHPAFAGKVTAHEGQTLRLEGAYENGPPVIEGPVTNYARVKRLQGWTGYPIDTLTEDGLRIKDYPLHTSEAVELSSVRYWAQN